MIDIRPYRTEDSDLFLELVRELQGWEARLYERMKPASEIGPWYLELVERQCREQDGTILIACESDQPVGYATIFTNVVEDGTGDELPYSYAHVGDLVVTQTARGRGVARLARNAHAHDVYLAFGFEDLHINMRKRLAT